MADLDVQPKKSRPWWIWLLLALIAIAVLFVLSRGCSRTNDDADAMGTTLTDTTTTTAAADGTATDDGWGTVDFNAPAATYEEITDRNIEVRGNDDYAIYSVDETVLFDTDKSTIKPQAAEKLKQIAGSMGKRFANSQVRIYGYTDARGSASYNKELAEERAAAVQNWLTQNGNIAPDNVTLHPVGEARPIASNETAAGRQQNRRVEIVARRAE
ncbi:OmpA family protein [Adhaeribacter rhizoryzae]|uniref:OmpA family protein n=1 Tax=Adhaeribacter rhizoryzae TaxID=2607907 RepID=A0A5M6DHX2_9BACT|nr:OmpA family protein [Adhaeribacter rhizoryzae]KAA5545789.1 OmpA family protein [Adhaeribacter rhizoryzae]